MNFKLQWLPTVLKDAGQVVFEVDGWKARGHGDMGLVRGVLLHHTAGPLNGDCPSLKVVINGRPDLAGPLSQLFLCRSGHWHVVAAGKAWHAGAGSWRGITDGNSSFIGIEAENTGLANDPWPSIQVQAYVVGVRALLKHIGAPADMAAGHKEYALPAGRKTDPSFDMEAFRVMVRNQPGATS